ncbi:hypothetical protein K457DRAFT_139267 [Linnemannia elongata AG-77]|uniref:Uncharacterized protein n=1 Tax=Linnemannia elongata AG-77 TaxID=1314771 RepID=A0A197JSB8_9FUNG|nr:hypothetical protein K457DRAFT_139267 [Linnemannia elongata AG-77]
METKVPSAIYTALLASITERPSALFASIIQDPSPLLASIIQDPSTLLASIRQRQSTLFASIRQRPSPLRALIKLQAREATKQIQKIAPEISPERVATVIFYVLLHLADPKAVDLSVFGEEAARVVVLSSMPYDEMAGFIATRLLKNPALRPVILQIIQASVCLFMGDFITVLGMGSMKIKSML